MTIRKLYTFFLVLAALAVISARSAAAQTLYIADSARQLFTYDVSTDTFTPIGSPMPTLMAGLGCDPSATLLYGTAYGNPMGIYSIDSDTAVATLLGRVMGYQAVGSTVGPDGNVWAISPVSPGLLYTIDPETLTATNIGNTGVPLGIGQPGFDIDGNLYTFGGSVLYQIDPTTAEATRIGNVGFGVIAAAFCDGTLYGFTGNRVIIIDTTTGAGAEIATYGLPVRGAIQAAACCTP